jgi:hypothetical protein
MGSVLKGAGNRWLLGQLKVLLNLREDGRREIPLAVMRHKVLGGALIIRRGCRVRVGRDGCSRGGVVVDLVMGNKRCLVQLRGSQQVWVVGVVMLEGLVGNARKCRKFHRLSRRACQNGLPRLAEFEFGCVGLDGLACGLA